MKNFMVKSICRVARIYIWRGTVAAVFVGAFVLAQGAAWGQAGDGKALAQPAGQSAEDGGMEGYIRRFTADWRGVSKFYDVEWSEGHFDRMTQFYRDEIKRLKGVKFAGLDQQGRIDYLLLRNKLTEELAHDVLDQKRMVEMSELMPFRRSLQGLEQKRRAMERVDAKASADEVSAIPEQIKKLRARIEKGRKAEKKDSEDVKADSTEAKADTEPALKVSAVLARRTADAVDSVRGSMKAWFAFYDGYQPEFSWWVAKPYAEAGKAMEDYAKYLREEVAGLKGKDEDPLVGDPIGAEGLAADLAAECIPYTPEELIGIADREFAWCEGEMKKAANEMGLGDDWKAALAKVKADYVLPGTQDELVSGLSREAIRFVKEHDLVTVPPLCEETWRLTMSSPETQKTLPFAAYGGQSMMVAYAKDEMKNEDKLMAMRGNNRHFTRIVVPHELIPGHHLQGFVAERNRGYRSIFRTPFLVEGWALYWELKLWDLGYGKSPEDQIGMLFWRMHRCARIIVSLKFHLGEMTPAQMVDFLVERVGHERSGATGEVRRFIGGAYSPLYQCAYMIGGMQLRALRNEAVSKKGMTEREFNDAVLTYNAIPIEMIRAGIMNVPLKADAGANWEFAGAHGKAE
ncbi:MAG: X-Pro dipeptidyl-peptidase [Pedosphaera sp.]|nr:X-Pro dipeptidyl-peptidase [Pedosphaera sp.]